MSWPALNAALQFDEGSVAAPDAQSQDPVSVRVSSRGLGWSGLTFERQESAPGMRDLPRGPKHHLVFLSLSGGKMVRESAGERVEHDLAPGCVALAPSGVPVRWRWSTRISFSVLLLEPAFLDRVAHEVFSLKPEDYRLVIAERQNDTAVNNIAGVLAREAMRGEPGGRLYAESLANILSVHLLRHYAQCADGRLLEACNMAEPESVAREGNTAAHQPRAVAEAAQFIHGNYANEVSLSDIAAAVHLSPFHLARLFKQVLGISPHQYLIQVRVNSARSLLSAGSGERSLAEIAAAVGFADQSHLTRHFKRITGITPRQFRP